MCCCHARLSWLHMQVMVHACVCLGLGRAAGIAMPVLIIASNSNIGGPATAAAMASARVSRIPKAPL